MTVAQIEKKVSELNSRLPLDMGDGLTLERMAVESGYVVMDCKAPTTDKSALENTKGDEFVIQARKAGVRSMYSDYLSAGLGAKQISRFADTGKSVTLSFSSQELKRMMSYPAEAYTNLWDLVKSTREDLPLDIGDGLTMTKCYCTMDEVVTTYDCDPNVYTLEVFERLQQGLQEQHDDFLKEIVNGTSELIDIAKVTAAAGFGYSIYYYIKGQQPSSLTLTYQELANALGINNK